MQHAVLSTYKILKEKAFNYPINESWIDWSIEMIQAGYETDSLYELAGISKPYNQFELEELTNRVFKELQLDYSNKETALKNYAYFLITFNLDKPENYHNLLKEFTDIYYDLDVKGEYQDLALLYWAKSDLMHETYQHYWEDATRENIDTIIKKKFEFLKEKFKPE